MRRPDERGAAAVEFVILVPVLVLLIGVIVAGARLAHARATVQQVADSAARSASLARDAASAEAFARRVAGLDVASAHLACAGGVGVTVDTSGFAVPVGQPASVRTALTCSVTLADLLVPGLPGSVRVDATGQSTLDRYRGRR